MKYILAEFSEVQDVNEALRDLVRNSQTIQLIRSGFTPEDRSGFLDAIKAGCKNSKESKIIRFILPSPGTIAMAQRERDLRGSGGNIENLSHCLEDWYEAIEKLRKYLEPTHSLELRKSPQPHRYHSFQGKMGMLYGQAWHSLPSMRHTVFISNKSKIYNQFLADFEWHWDILQPSRQISPESIGTQTVMFSDIVGYSKRTPNLPRDKLVKLIQLHRSIVAASIDIYGGRIVNRVGDALVMVFRDASLAVRAGEHIQENIALHNASGRLKSEKFRVRIGISTGALAEMPDGHDSILVKDVFGASVNLASRVQANSLPDEVHFCDLTHRLIPRNERLRCKRISRTPKLFKGMEDAPIFVWRLNK